MPELPQQILLLREGGMFQHLPAQIMKMWWFSSTLRMPDHYEQTLLIPKGFCVNHLYIHICVPLMFPCERETMPEVSQQILLLRETGMVQHRPAKMIKCDGSPLHLECLILLLQQRTNMKSK